MAIRTLAMVAAPGAPIVLVFDQLENLVEGETAGSRLLAYAHLTSELVDTVRGLTPCTWRSIRSGTGASSRRSTPLSGRGW